MSAAHAKLQPIWVDFSKGGVSPTGHRFVILRAMGTLRDLLIDRVRLYEGLPITVYSDDVDDSGEADYLAARGVVHYDASRKEWWAELGGVVSASDASTDAGKWVGHMDWDVVRRRTLAWEQLFENQPVTLVVDELGYVTEEKTLDE